MQVLCHKMNVISHALCICMIINKKPLHENAEAKLLQKIFRRYFVVLADFSTFLPLQTQALYA